MHYAVFFEHRFLSLPLSLPGNDLPFHCSPSPQTRRPTRLSVRRPRQLSSRCLLQGFRCLWCFAPPARFAPPPYRLFPLSALPPYCRCRLAVRSSAVAPRRSASVTALLPRPAAAPAPRPVSAGRQAPPVSAAAPRPRPASFPRQAPPALAASVRAAPFPPGFPPVRSVPAAFPARPRPRAPAPFPRCAPAPARRAARHSTPPPQSALPTAAPRLFSASGLSFVFSFLP